MNPPEPIDPTAGRAIRAARPDLDARVRVPGSKSVTNRALLLAALAEGRSLLRGALFADDATAFASGLRALGVTVRQGVHGLLVDGAGGPLPAAAGDVYCAEAGTAARFLLAAAAAGDGVYRFDGAPQLRRRPLGQLLAALRDLGASTEPAAADGLPLMLLARGLSGGELTLPGDTSSQFVSALLMAAPLGRAPLDLQVRGLVSRPYVSMTMRMMAAFGIDASEMASDRYHVPLGRYGARDYAIEPDASTASYFFAAAAVSGGRVLLDGLQRRGGLQGDVAFVDVLEAMGCTVTQEADGVRVAGPAALAGLDVDMTDIPDTFMTLAAIAPLATSPVTITGIGNVRLKESDRIAAMEDNLRRTGITTESGTDWLRIVPGTPHGAVIDPHGDHRIAMAFSVLGLRVPGIVIDDPACVAKTCPDFFALWSGLEQRPDTPDDVVESHR